MNGRIPYISYGVTIEILCFIREKRHPEKRITPAPMSDTNITRRTA